MSASLRQSASASNMRTRVNSAPGRKRSPTMAAAGASQLASTARVSSTTAASARITPSASTARIAPNASTSVVSASFLSSLTNGASATSAANASAASAPESVVISMSDLQRMQQTAVITSAQDEARNRTRSDASKRALAEKARLRKEKMLAMEMERKARANDQTETEVLQGEQNRVLIAHAKQAMDEELDDVKHMNQMMLYAKCVTIRDAQILEKQKLQEELAEEERRLDTTMEVERVRTLKMYEEREKVRQAEQKIGAAVIIKQIQEREADRIRQQELREQDAQAMVARIRELELREEEERKEKVVAGRRLLEQVMKANNAQARSKLRKKQEEIEEDLRIAEYLRQKELREAEQEHEAERIAAEKEKEIARLRAMQEKAQDRQSAIDELRAKRYQEQKDRAWRKTQMQLAEKKDTMKRDIAAAREQQRQEKARQMAEQALQEREEYHQILDWQRAQNEIDRKKVEEEVDKRRGHRSELLSQIEQHEREKAIARRAFLEEGTVIARQLAADKKKLLKLKQEKLAALEGAGVPEKYRAELAKKKVMVSSIH